MSSHSPSLGFISHNYEPNVSLIPIGQSYNEYGAQKDLFHAQPLSVRCVLEIQANLIVKAILNSYPNVDITLPKQVVWKSANTKQTKRLQLPGNLRAQSIKGHKNFLKFEDLIRVLDEFDRSSEPAIFVYAMLLRYAISSYLTTTIMPPAATDYTGIKESFPQWITFDTQNHLILKSEEEAQFCITSLKQCVILLQVASKIAPYINQVESFHQRINELQEQLITQGRSLARYQTDQVIETIKTRVAANNLNRGLTLRLPYFDDRLLELQTYDFVVIPKGRIQFDPVYVWWVAKNEQENIMLNSKLNSSTKNHLIQELRILQEAFEVPEIFKSANLFFHRKRGIKDRFKAVRLAFNAITTKSLINTGK